MHRFFRIDRLVNVLVTLAGLSFVSSLVILVHPGFQLPAGIEQRAMVSQSLSTALALMMGMIAILVSAGVETSEYRAQEKLRGDLARLGVALHSAVLKTALWRVSKKPPAHPDFEFERTAIGEFVCSTTGFAFMCWAAAKGEEARSSGSSAEQPWRVFTADLGAMQMRRGQELAEYLDSHKDMVDDLLRILGDLSDKDVGSISEYLSNLKRSMSLLARARSDDPMVTTWRNLSAKGQDATSFALVPESSHNRPSSQTATSVHLRGGQVPKD